ncbi:hypothetical protein B0H66DRAFT_399192 [Apodospora peruviana]|uniref:AB hydrolase-1 domain-containing protein n=1 Tax=Apodospora peruviana TaxID=516989 RepID=A0AAE0LYJ3_9PEZI|nr:hypothetical protein B0H66DRAFT_399192 [Apodospora peruviana]
MDPSSLSAVPPIPRRSRERDHSSRPRDQDRDRPQPSSRRRNAPPAISTHDTARDRNHEDVFHDWSDRDRERYVDRYLRDRDPEKPAPVSAGSPEVISSLITSLSAISRPLSNHFDGPNYFNLTGTRSPHNLSVPGSPTGGGSFGVDYGAFSQPSLGDLRDEDVPLDELAASAPVIRTSKPPSGFSPLTAPKSPKSPSNRDASGLRSLLSRGGSSGALSRPSSKGSLASGAESIGKLSIERGNEPTSPGADTNALKRQKSVDSWGKKNGRNQRGLMYMSSKEQLREKEAEKKRASIGAVGGNANGLASPSLNSASRLDPLSAESIINEEPHSESPLSPERTSLSVEGSNHPATSPRHIPTRDSSLRKTSSSGKRSSARASRTSKRDGDGANDTIHEIDEPSSGLRNSRSDTARHRQNTAKRDEFDPLRLSADLPRANSTTLSKPRPDIYSTSPSTPSAAMFPDMEDDDDGAPSPAIAQGRRRDREVSADARHRRRSGHLTPDAHGYASGYGSETGGGGVKLKRSSSKLKRLSASPNPSKTSDHGAGARGSTHSDQPHIAYERPRSADSVDDAVESYLCSPRLSQKIRHPQTGRVISFSEVGDPNGSAVFCCVGMGLTRYITAFYDELALTLKLRLITPDRPGVGDSEPYAEGTATPLGWPDDVYAICQSLKITKFSILAHSAGAIYALATALRMPQHIRGRIHLLAPWIPPSQMSVFGASAATPLPPTNAIPTSQKILRALPTPFLKAANSSFMTATSSSITSSLPKQKRAKREKKSNAAAAAKEAKEKAANHGIDNKENHGSKDVPHTQAADEDMDRIRPTGTAPTTMGPTSNGHRHNRSNSSSQHLSRRQSEKDEHILSAAAMLADSQLADRERQQTYDNRLTHAIWQLATTGANPAVDLLVCLERRHTIGFRYVDITRPVVIHHGSRDTRVPVENVRWLGKTMRRCEVRVLEGEGHGLMASAQVMGGVLMEVSQEWEEWSRVTGATRREHERSRRGTIGQAR